MCGLENNNVKSHIVQPSETLYSIAKKYGVSVEALQSANNLSDNTIFPNQPLKIPTSENEIIMFNDITDDMILKNQQREKYLTVRENPDYEVVSGDNMSKIASKFKVSIKLLLAYNNISDKDAGKIAIGQRLKIPPTRVARNIKNLGDVSKALGISKEAVESIKTAEDGTKMGKNNFHNHAYIDGAGVKTIGIGHVVKAGEAEVLNNQEVCETFANDLLKAEENLYALLGKKNYETLPEGLDMVFNKGAQIIEKTPGLLENLKNGQYEDAICKFTNNKSVTTGKEMSGLSKRRILDISMASKDYGDNIPVAVINTAQAVYNDGIRLLREEYPNEQKFLNMLAGYNEDVQNYMGDKIKLITK